MAPRIWHKSYTPGIPHEIDVSGLRSIAELFHESVVRYGGQPAFTNFGKTLSFTDAACFVGIGGIFMAGIALKTGCTGCTTPCENRRKRPLDWLRRTNGSQTMPEGLNRHERSQARNAWSC